MGKITKKATGTGVLVLVLSLFLAAGQGEKKVIGWQTDYETAVKQAEEKSMPLIVFFTADWSPPSRTMYEKVWANEEVVEQAGKFVAIQVDVDRFPEIAKKFNVKAFPTVILSDPSGEIKIQLVGIMPAREMATMMKVFPRNFNEIIELKKKLEENKKDLEALRGLADFYADINIWELSSDYYKQALKHIDIEDNEELKDSIVFSLAMNELRLNHYKEAQKIFEEELKEYPKDKSSENLLYGLMVSYIGQKKIEEAEKTYKKLKSKYPDSKVTEEAGRILEMMKKRIRTERDSGD